MLTTRHLGPCLLAVLFAVVGFAAGTQGGDGGSLAPPTQPEGIPYSSDRYASDWEDEPITEGFFFMDGKYFAPPYTISSDEEAVYVNDLRIPLDSLRVDRDGGRRRFRRGAWHFAEELREQLEADGVLVVDSGRPLVSLFESRPRHLFFRILAAPAPRPELFDELYAVLPWEADRARWDQWLTAYSPPQDLVARARAEVDAIDAVIELNTSAAAAVQRLDTYAYPLTVFGMVMTVLAFGHLLSVRPAGGDVRVDSSPEASRLVVRSIALVIVFSVLDLVWTILASQAGQIRELNPVGSRLIENPAALVAFKMSATFVAAGLILALWRYRPAQLASWWACLILTLLTVRWLAVNSLFV